jgi:hypothetical protein
VVETSRQPSFSNRKAIRAPTLPFLAKQENGTLVLYFQKIAMARVAKAASQDSLAVFFGAGEHGFVDLAIRILGHYCAAGAIGSYRTATVTK